MNGSTFNPSMINDFDKSKLNYAARGVSANPTIGGTTNIDLKLTDDHLLTGVVLITDGSTFGDKIDFQVWDIDGVLGPANTMLNQFVTDWFVFDKAAAQYDVAYPAKIYAGLYLRVVYHSTGPTTPFVAVNYKLHKVLV